MDLQTILEDILNKVAGTTYVSCVGMDGIALSQAIKEVPFDPAVADAEFANVIGHAVKAVTSLDGGEFEEMFFITDRYTVLLKGINKDAFLAIALTQGVKNLGLARIQVKKAADELKKILE